MRYFLTIVLVVIQAGFLAWIGWLWALAVRSLFPRRPPPATDETPFFTIIVPAHNEGEIIGQTVEKILACDYPRDRFSLNVIADNCDDDTAEIARNAGATVLDRVDQINRGKGHALAYALDTLRDEPGDAVLFLDADSSPERDYLQVLASYHARGDVMVQGRYDVTDPDRNWFTRLTATSFVLRNRWQFPAFDAWRLTLPLRGSGMSFQRSLIYRLGWESHGLNEDMEMTLRLIHENIPVTFAANAVCRQFMPATPAQARTQRQRWSAGEHNLRKTIFQRELPGALKRREWRAALSLVNMAAPPFSLQLCVALGLLLPAYVAGGSAWALSLVAVGLFAGYFFLGLERLDKQGVAAAAMLPLYAVWRVGIYLAALFRKPAEWIRTARSGK